MEPNLDCSVMLIPFQHLRVIFQMIVQLVVNITINDTHIYMEMFCC